MLYGRDALRPWIVVGAVWITLAVASGLYFSFPIFFVALLEEFGWSRGATAAAFSISAVVQGLLSPVVGIIVDRVGPRRVLLGGAALLGGACALSSRVGSLWSLYVVTGGLFRQVARLPDFLGGPVFAGAWLENGDAMDEWSFAHWRSNAGTGLVMDTLVGPVIVAGSWSFDGRWRTYLAIGRVFR